MNIQKLNTTEPCKTHTDDDIFDFSCLQDDNCIDKSVLDSCLRLGESSFSDNENNTDDDSTTLMGIALFNSNPDNRMKAVIILCNRGAITFNGLAKLSLHPRTEIRIAVSMALNKTFKKFARNIFLKLMFDECFEVRRISVQGLLNITIGDDQRLLFEKTQQNIICM